MTQARKKAPKQPVKAKKPAAKSPRKERPDENPKHREDFERLLDDAVFVGGKESK